jgi:hypothetical protein
MSVISESRAGDELVCIESFTGWPRDDTAPPKSRRAFRIGERVRYVDYYQDQNLADNPVCWMVLFDAADGRRYAATQTYFVTEECWQDLKKFFARRLLREPRRHRGLRVPSRDPRPGLAS